MIVCNDSNSGRNRRHFCETLFLSVPIVLYCRLLRKQSIQLKSDGVVVELALIHIRFIRLKYYSIRIIVKMASNDRLAECHKSVNGEGNGISGVKMNASHQAGHQSIIRSLAHKALSKVVNSPLHV
jgi:hypothetical protein